MKCPLQTIIQTEVVPGGTKGTADLFQCDPFCQWYDNAEKLCAVLSMAKSLKILATDYKAL